MPPEFLQFNQIINHIRVQFNFWIKLITAHVFFKAEQ